MVGIADADNNVSYSRYHYYELRDSDRLYAELIEPTGRLAVVRITEVDGTGAITQVRLSMVGWGMMIALGTTVSLALKEAGPI